MENEILRRIRLDYDAERICLDLSLSLEELFYYINNINKYEMKVFTKISSNGKIMFDFKRQNYDDDVELKVVNGTTSFVAIADPHIGSAHDNVQRFDSINTFLSKNNIKTLVNLGDLIDGPVHQNQSRERRIPDLETQIEEAIKLYPYIFGPNIIVLGGHDLEYKTANGYSINKALKQYRTDIKTYSSGVGILKYGKERILLCHDTDDKWIQDRLRRKDYTMVLSGHSHCYKDATNEVGKGGIIDIVVPSLSDLPITNGIAPGFLKIDMNYERFELQEILVSNYTFIDSKVYLVGVKSYGYSMTQNKEESYERTRNNSHSNKKGKKHRYY